VRKTDVRYTKTYAQRRRELQSDTMKKRQPERYRDTSRYRIQREKETDVKIE
jgi:hypothetical protein